MSWRRSAAVRAACNLAATMAEEQRRAAVRAGVEDRMQMAAPAEDLMQAALPAIRAVADLAAQVPAADSRAAGEEV